MRFVLPVLALLLCVSCDNAGTGGRDYDIDLIQNPHTAGGYDEGAGLPVLAFDADLHDFGRISEGESISYSFHFTNKGSGDLVITNAQASCGCTVADYPKGRIAPGGEGYVTVSFNSRGKVGVQYQEVILTSNAQPARSVLRIAAQVSN